MYFLLLCLSLSLSLNVALAYLYLMLKWSVEHNELELKPDSTAEVAPDDGDAADPDEALEGVIEDGDAEVPEEALEEVIEDIPAPVDRAHLLEKKIETHVHYVNKLLDTNCQSLSDIYNTLREHYGTD